MKFRLALIALFMLQVSPTLLAQTPVEFVENRGQWGSWFRYKAEVPSGDICLENDGVRYVLADPDNNYKLDYFHHGQTAEKPVLKFHCYKMSFVGAQNPVIEGHKEKKIYYNYFLGNNPQKWKSGIHPVRDVDYTNIYNGIDVHFSSDKGTIVYEFFVRPQADASDVQLKFEGQDAIEVTDGNLLITTSVGKVTELKPIAYQDINGNRVDVPCHYSLDGNVVTYDFPKGYDHSSMLVIDPVVVLCTLTGSTADNWGYTATYDNAGNFYAGGLVNCLSFGGSFPVTTGAFQTTYNGGYGTLAMTDSTYACDISIIKYDPTLATRIYATYLGGTGNERPHSLIVDPAGDLIVGGRSRSTDYPVTAGCYQATNHGGWDIVVTKFNPACTALIGSTYIGGSGNDGVNFDSTELGYGELKYNYGDDARSEVQIDKSGNIYMADCTNSSDFPTTATAIATTIAGLQDGVIFKLTSNLTSLLWSTYIGGNGSDAGYALAFDTAQSSIYVGGGTNSTNFPVVAGCYQTTFGGGTPSADGFVLKFKSSTPYTLQKGTYVGTANYDQVYGIQVGNDNSVYVMGQSLGGAFPVTAGVYSNPNSSQFVMKMDSNLTTDQISTVFGSGDPTVTNISPVAFLVDTCNNVYISGWGGSLGIGLPTSGYCLGMPVTPDAWQSTTDGMDFYFIVLGSNLATLRYASFYGRYCTTQWEGEHVDGGTSRFNKQGIIYQGICANCGGVPPESGACPALFPTTAGVWAPEDSSQNCNEASLKIAFNIGPVTATVNASPSTTGCAPLTVDFSNLSDNGVTYVWNFGDGSAILTTTATTGETHTFNSAGTFTVTLSGENSNSCYRTNDTAYLIVTVGTNTITPSFNYVVNDSCGPYIATFTNTSTDGADGTPTYTWYFGDGSSYSGTNPPAHTYAAQGTYSVVLVMSDLMACKTPDTVSGIVTITSFNVSGNFSMPDSVCLGLPVLLSDTAQNARTIYWNFGDGNTSSSNSPDHSFGSVGTYTVTFVVANAEACNKADTIEEVIKILSGPLANFSFTPTIATANVPTTFTNLSYNAMRYLWNFGDNTSSVETNPVHQYNVTGTYKACLTAYNSSDCPSNICKEVPTDVEPLVGLPSAFSPNNDGENDILYVKGAAIQTLDLKIFNRWGQLIFETTSQEKGWDGTYNGEPQPIEAYAYVLSVTFIDGTSKLLKGNVTLLR